MNKSGQTAHDIAKFWGHRHIVSLLSDGGSIRLDEIGGSTRSEEHENYFAREYLDRISDKRTDAEWLLVQQRSPDTVFLLFHDSDPLVTSEPEESSVTLCRLRRDDVEDLLQSCDTLVLFLGVERRDGAQSPDKKNYQDKYVAWFALSVKDDPTEKLRLTTSNTFFLKKPMPSLLMLSEEDAGEKYMMNISQMRIV